MKVHLKIDCYIETEHLILPDRVCMLDVIEKGVRVIKATQIYPGANLSMTRARR